MVFGLSLIALHIFRNFREKKIYIFKRTLDRASIVFLAMIFAILCMFRIILTDITVITYYCVYYLLMYLIPSLLEKSIYNIFS